MTKTLTEQWKDFELPEGLYYFKTRYNNIFIGYPRERNMFRAIDDGLFDESDKIEVLAPVPSYNEYCLLTKKAERADYLDEKLKYYTPEECLIIKQLEKKLAIATKALKKYADYGNWWGCLDEDDNIVEEGMFRERGYEPAKEALKEMEGVK